MISKSSMFSNAGDKNVRIENVKVQCPDPSGQEDVRSCLRHFPTNTQQFPLVSYRLFPIVCNQLYLIVSSHFNERYKSTFSSQPILPYQFLLSSFTDQFPANLKFPRKFTADKLHCFPSPALRESIAQIGSCDGWWDSHYEWWKLPLWEVRLCDSSHCNSIPSYPTRLQPSLTLQPTWNDKCIRIVSVYQFIRITGYNTCAQGLQ